MLVFYSSTFCSLLSGRIPTVRDDTGAVSVDVIISIHLGSEYVRPAMFYMHTDIADL